MATAAPPPNLPMPGNNPMTGKTDSVGPSPAPKSDNSKSSVPVEISSPPPFMQRPGGGADAPDPFSNSVRSNNNLTNPTDLTRSAENLSGQQATNMAPGVGALPSSAAASAAPLAPAAFRKPAPPRRNRRFVVLIGGSLILILLLTALGMIAARLILGNNSKSQPLPSTSPVVQASPATDVQSPIQNVVSPSPNSAAQQEVLDIDKDGLTTAEERFYSTNPDIADTDGDGFSDGDEVRAGYDPLSPGKLDSDNDGFPDPDERSFGSDPFNPDTDGDGFSDGDEIKNGYNPLIPSPGDKL